MKADAKLVTRESVSMASARFAVIGASAARRITHPSSAINRYDAAVALMSTSRRLGLPRTRSSIWRFDRRGEARHSALAERRPQRVVDPPEERLDVGAASEHHRDREHRESGGTNRKRAEDTEPQRRQRQPDQCDGCADADDDHGADQVGNPFERDRGGRLPCVDRPGQQHDLERFAGNPAQREIAECLGGQPHARETQEADLPRLREACRPGPRAHQVPQATEEQGERQRDAETPSRLEGRRGRR